MRRSSRFSPILSFAFLFCSFPSSFLLGYPTHSINLILKKKKQSTCLHTVYTRSTFSTSLRPAALAGLALVLGLDALDLAGLALLLRVAELGEDGALALPHLVGG